MLSDTDEITAVDYDDDLEMGYEGATLDKSFLVKPKTAQSATAGPDGSGGIANNPGDAGGAGSGVHKDCRTLPLPEEDAELHARGFRARRHLRRVPGASPQQPHALGPRVRPATGRWRRSSRSPERSRSTPTIR